MILAALLACGALLSCSNGSDSPMVGTTGGGVTQTGGGGTTTTTGTGGGEQLTVIVEDETDNVDAIVDAIRTLTESGTVKATGKLNNTSVSKINAALKELASRDENILVTLDLSEVIGLLSLESALDRYGYNEPQKSFYGCSNLAGIILPNTLKSVGWYAFRDCTGLKSITIPDSVHSIGLGAFSGCVSLEEITLPISGDYCYVIEGRNKYQTENALFGRIFGTESYTGAVSVTQYCWDRTLVVGGGTNYRYFREDNVYYLPPFLKKVNITSGCLCFGCFENCSGLTDITIGFGVTEIGCGVTCHCDGVFNGCTALTNINYDGTLAQWCEGQGFNELRSYTSKICIQGQDIQEITNLEIPDGVKSICSSAFSGWNWLTSVIIPNSVTTIGNYAFRGCTGLTSVIIPGRVAKIEESAFSSCTGLASVTIPASVTKIDRYAFSDCSSLASAIFSDTDKWFYTSKADYTNGTVIDSASLVNPATAATYLKKYTSCYWYKL